MPFPIESIRSQFPILQQKVNNKNLVYLDNGATTQKPQCVIDAIVEYYTTINANVHRGIHTLSQLATDAMEQSRQKVQHFIHAQHPQEVIFTKGTTEGINMIAHGITHLIQEGDEILISGLEHHANIVPWQMLCQRTGAVLKHIPVLDSGALDIAVLDTLLTSKTKIVAFNQVSNAFGVVNPFQFLIEKAHAVGAWVVLDGAQAVAHSVVDVQKMDVDFYVFSGHKMYAPTGIGILYGKEHLLDQLDPWQGGGEMIETVTFEKTTYAGLPFRLEAGTPHIEGAIVLGTAIDWLLSVGMEAIHAYEKELLEYATQRIAALDFVTIYAEKEERAGVISFNFNLNGVHSSDVGSILDKMGIAVRTGHHCAQPIMQRFHIPGTIRASIAIYNTKEDIDKLIDGLQLAYQMLG